MELAMNEKLRRPPKDYPVEPESFERLPAARIPRAERSQVMWSWVAVLAMVFVLGVTFYAIDARQDQRAAPQATASTAASGRAAAPATAADPEPAAQTTGQGAR
jgi:hypothetical protein